MKDSAGRKNGQKGEEDIALSVGELEGQGHERSGDNSRFLSKGKKELPLLDWTHEKPADWCWLL